MFAFVGSRDARHATDITAALGTMAREHNIPETAIHQLALRDFRLAFFDTAKEVAVHKNDRYLMILIGTLINKSTLEEHLDYCSENDAELILQTYQKDPDLLSLLDGHFAFALYDASDNSIALIGDRFHRYSIVYTDEAPVYVSSHSYILSAFSKCKELDPNGFSQAVHFRWLMGESKLLKGVKQVLPGSIVRIEKDDRVIRGSYFKPAFKREANLNIEHWVQEVDSAVDACLSKIADQHPVIGVPLSGGVDSSLLLAKAKEHFHECIAVTARFTNGENPELDNARNIARQLGVRHIVADIDDDYIRDSFPRLVRIHEQPPRNFSDIALARSFEALQGIADAFIYGEAADTLFGLDAVHRVASLGRMAKPFERLPQPLRKLAARMLPDRGYRLRRLKWAIENGVDALVNGIEKIPYVTPPWQLYSCSRLPQPDNVLNEHLAHGGLPLGDRAAIQLLATGVMNHIENTGRLATYYGLKMYVPFVLNDLRSVAARIPFELQSANGAYKLVLRELACRYFDREYIYSDKFGFPTPSRNWLKGPLSDRVERARKGYGQGNKYYCARSLSELSMDEDFEHFWFAICLDELLGQLDTQSAGIRVAA
jgi:asparagine synthase (glutamine-hydrolysing)